MTRSGRKDHTMIGLHAGNVDPDKRPPPIDKSKFFKTYEEAYAEGECDGSFNERQRNLHLVLGLRAQVKNLKKKVHALENK